MLNVQKVFFKNLIPYSTHVKLFFQVTKQIIMANSVNTDQSAPAGAV